MADPVRERQKVIVRALREMHRRVQPIETPELFPEQQAFIDDPAKWKALFTPRRCGKSFTIGTMLWTNALRYPARQQVYVGLTQPHAERVIYREILEPTLRRRGVEHSYEKDACLVTFANGSTIQLMGGDAQPKNLEQVLGGRPHLVAVDEAQSWKHDLESYCRSKVWPALQDYKNDGGGWLILGGTPGTQLGNHYWFRVTKTDAYGQPDVERVGGWKVHSWPMSKNPHMRAQFEDEAKRRELEAGGRYDWSTAPDWRREWLGQWVLDADARVYRFSDKPLEQGGNVLTDRDLTASLLSGRDPQWTYVVGVDLGWKDPTAWVLVAWRPADPRLYVVRSYQRVEWAYGDIGRALKQLYSTHRAPNGDPLIQQFIVDCANGKAANMIASFGQDFELPAKPADMSVKQGKANHVARMNSDFLDGKIAVVVADGAEGNRELCKNWLEHTLDPSKDTWSEHTRSANHLPDAGLYAHIAAQHRLAVAPTAGPVEEARATAFREHIRRPRGGGEIVWGSDRSDW